MPDNVLPGRIAEKVDKLYLSPQPPTSPDAYLEVEVTAIGRMWSGALIKRGWRCMLVMYVSDKDPDLLHPRAA